MDLNSVVKQSSDPISAEIDGELVMMSIEKGNYYGLTGIGNRIWQLLETPIKVSALCDKLVEEYDVEKAVCEADTLEFLRELSGQGLIELA
ncbi:MAG TPA: lasso peptide biosynthesis PqqD family chaperone [Gallionella sp.]|nr:lasso peptide biosynthesis PqqD family chaperone [Gallionella sp.]